MSYQKSVLNYARNWAKISQLNFQLVWTSGLTPQFIFSTLCPNNFQTVIDSEKCSKSTHNFGKKCIYPENFSTISQIKKKNLKQNIRKLRYFFLLFKVFSFFCFF